MEFTASLFILDDICWFTTWKLPLLVTDSTDDAPNLEYDPHAAAFKAKQDLLVATKNEEKRRAAEEAELEASTAGGQTIEEQQLAKKLNVVMAKTSPPRTSKQPSKALQQESMGDLDTSDKDALMASYRDFHATASNSTAAKEDNREGEAGSNEEKIYDW